MWDTVETSTVHLSHDPLCPRCGHAYAHLPLVRRRLRVPAGRHARQPQLLI